MSIQTLNQAFDSGRAGVANSQALLRESAVNIAQSNGQTTDISTQAINLTQASIQASASLEVLERSNELIGSIIDIYV